MKNNFKVTKEMIALFNTLTYEESVKFFSVLTLLEKYGITESIIEKWGSGKNKREYLLIPVSRTFREGEADGKIPEEIIHSITIDLSRV